MIRGMNFWWRANFSSYGKLTVILVGRSGSICATSPNSVNCVQAYVWDEQLEQFNTFGGHKKND